VTTLLRYGPFTVKGRCKDGPGYQSRVTIESSKKAWGIGMVDTADPDEIGDEAKELLPSFANGNPNVGTARGVTAYTNANEFISVGGYAVNKADEDTRD
jgi:hypothetical protein